MLAPRRAGVLPPRPPAAGFARLDGGENEGFHPNFSARLRRTAPNALVTRADALSASDSRGVKPPPASTLTIGPAVGTNAGSPFFKGTLASSGHRGRDEARGQPDHRAPGLTRTSPRGANAPSRVRRGTSPLAPRRAELFGKPPGRSQKFKPRCARRAHRPSREGALAAWLVVRVKPGSLPERWPRVSSRPRWPDEAKVPLKTRAAVFVPTARALVSAEAGGGLTSR